jgi:Tol biopolymer transport system component
VPESKGVYLWAIYEDFDIFVTDKKGNIVKQLTNEPGYDAEATVSPDGKSIVFTSTRSGDLELYIMDIDGSNVRQITHDLGYDGGAFFSPDSKKLVFRSSRPKTEEEIKSYKDYLSRNLVAPTNMEIYTVNVDGSELKQLTHLGKANWAPFYHPSGDKIIFSSNHHSERGYDFQLFTINTDGTKITSSSISFVTSSPSNPEPRIYGIQFQVRFVFGVFLNGQTVNTTNGNISVSPKIWLIRNKPIPAPVGETPYEIYFNLTT